ncbi:MAG: signal peptidase II [Cyanobacteria bacterium P01_A01_bin.80]
MNFKNSSFWIVAVIAVVFDQLTKRWVISVLDSWVMRTEKGAPTQPLIPGIFHFTYIQNTGAAWGIFSGEGWLRWLSLLVSVGLIAIALFGPVLSFWERLGFGFILGGAVGNGIDRFMLGYVIDFLHFKLIDFPVFNVADVSINAGLVCLLIGYFRSKPNPARR